jgi:hypothetical protein
VTTYSTYTTYTRALSFQNWLFTQILKSFIFGDGAFYNDDHPFMIICHAYTRSLPFQNWLLTL